MRITIGDGTKGSKIADKKVGSLRRAQLITTYGSGAIASLPGYSVIIAATDLWTASDWENEIHEPNLEKLLKVKGFRQPFSGDDSADKHHKGVTAFRFPKMHFCPQCGELKPYRAFGKEDVKVCPRCNKTLVPSRFVIACINGHLEDFPYAWWVHYGHDNCSEHGKSDLKIHFTDETGGLDSIIIECNKCKKKRSMAGCMNPESLKGFHCNGIKPWISYDYSERDTCTAQVKTLQRSASNVYFGLTASALTIPPWSNKIQQTISKHWPIIKSILDNSQNVDLELKYCIQYNMGLKKLINEKLSVEDIIREIKRYSTANASTTKKDSDYNSSKLLEDEYQVFCEGTYEKEDDLQFRIASSKVPDWLSGYIDDIILVKRLREVLALYGFRRLTTDKPNNDKDNSGYVPLSKNKVDWLPAIEMLGEGLFIRLNLKKVEEWEALNTKKYEAMGSRLEKSVVDCDNFSPRFVLLHTLAHLLIRQLSIECGYEGAAIKERIYSVFPNSNVNMCGILLYTSTTDSDGSLGGLVRMGTSNNFELIFRNMLQEASWCSSDPICMQSRAQGLDSLNYAACHACTLLPETSCVMRNCLLDRTTVVGELVKNGCGFFEALL